MMSETWSTGETLKSADALGNLDAMKNEAQKLDTANVETANPWITTAHIMQPRYDITTNITNNVSGVFGGRNNGGTWQNTSYFVFVAITTLMHRKLTFTKRVNKLSIDPTFPFLRPGHNFSRSGYVQLLHHPQ